MFTLYQVAFGSALKNYPVYTVLTFHFGDWRSAASPQYRNRNEITVRLLCVNRSPFQDDFPGGTKAIL